MSQAKNWTFTVNNYVGLCDFEVPEASFVSYAIYQEEVGESGTPHLQGYLMCDRRVRLTQLQAIPCLEGAHFEVARGSLADNVAYCSKVDTAVGGPYEYGVPPAGQGSRSDLLAVKRTIDEGVDVAGLYEQHFAHMIRYGRSLLTYKKLRSSPRTEKPFVFFFCGTAGSGKTRTAYALAQMLGSVYFVPATKGSGLYFDDYDQQTSVIFDEFDGHRCSPTFLNQLLDRYPFEVPVHGAGGRQFNSPFVFIISNYHPKYWWKRSVSIAPFVRRVDLLLKFVFRPLEAPAPPRLLRYNGVSTAYNLLFSVP